MSVLTCLFGKKTGVEPIYVPVTGMYCVNLSGYATFVRKEEWSDRSAWFLSRTLLRFSGLNSHSGNASFRL